MLLSSSKPYRTILWPSCNLVLESGDDAGSADTVDSYTDSVRSEILGRVGLWEQEEEYSDTVVDGQALVPPARVTCVWFMRATPFASSQSCVAQVVGLLSGDFVICCVIIYDAGLASQHWFWCRVGSTMTASVRYWFCTARDMQCHIVSICCDYIDSGWL